VVKEVNMSNNAWCKLIYVGVHLGLLNLSFIFCPFENHYEVHHRYSISPAGEEFLLNPTSLISLDPCSSTIVTVLINSNDVILPSKRYTQSRRSQIKPRLVKLIKNKMWKESEIELLKY